MTCFIEGFKILYIDLHERIREAYNLLNLKLFRDVDQGEQDSPLKFIITTRFKIMFISNSQHLFQTITLTSLDLVRVDSYRHLILVY